MEISGLKGENVDWPLHIGCRGLIWGPGVEVKSGGMSVHDLDAQRSQGGTGSNRSWPEGEF